MITVPNKENVIVHEPKLKLTNVCFVSEITKNEVNVITVPNKENVIVYEP